MLKFKNRSYLRTAFQLTTTIRTHFSDGKTRLYVLVNKAALAIAFDDDERAE